MLGKVLLLKVAPFRHIANEILGVYYTVMMNRCSARRSTRVNKKLWLHAYLDDKLGTLPSSALRKPGALKVAGCQRDGIGARTDCHSPRADLRSGNP